MKKIFRLPSYLLIFLIVSVSCKTIGLNATQDNLTEINLHLKGFNPTEHKSFIDVKIENAINPISKQLKISETGVVSFNFSNFSKKETSLLWWKISSRLCRKRREGKSWKRKIAKLIYSRPTLLRSLTGCPQSPAAMKIIGKLPPLTSLELTSSCL